MKKLLVIALCSICLPCAAQWKLPEPDYGEEKPWVEQETTLPDYPKQENWLPFYASSATDNKFYIDSKSITVGKDDVVRYTLITQSPNNVLNTTFEGMRCGTAEFKLYAIGHSDGTWAKPKQTNWQRVLYKDRNRHHSALYDNFFCPKKTMVKDAKEAISALRLGSHPNSSVRPDF